MAHIWEKVKTSCAQSSPPPPPTPIDKIFVMHSNEMLRWMHHFSFIGKFLLSESLMKIEMGDGHVWNIVLQSFRYLDYSWKVSMCIGHNGNRSRSLVLALYAKKRKHLRRPCSNRAHSPGLSLLTVEGRPFPLIQKINWWTSNINVKAWYLSFITAADWVDPPLSKMFSFSMYHATR